jgi:hypothetical protein
MNLNYIVDLALLIPHSTRFAVAHQSATDRLVTSVSGKPIRRQVGFNVAAHLNKIINAHQNQGFIE